MSEETERRLVILRAAQRLIEHYGLSKTTIADIAREASIGVGSVYLEFGSKNDIVGQIADAKYGSVLSLLQHKASVEAPAAERLRGVLDARVRAFRELASCGMHAPDVLHCSCDAVARSWDRYCSAEFELVRRVISAGQVAGELGAGDPEERARTVLDAYAVFGPPWTRALHVDDFEARINALHDLVVRGLR